MVLCSQRSLGLVKGTKFTLWLCQSPYVCHFFSRQILNYFMWIGGASHSHSLTCLMVKSKNRKKKMFIWRRKRTLADDLRLRESPASGSTAKNVVIVMDGFKDLTMEPLEWALENIITPGSTVTLLGSMPWLNIPLYSKTWRDVWMLEFKDLIIAKENPKWKSDAKYLKLQALLDLCKKYGVVPQKEVVMGFPLRLLVLERIISLQATWVVFDSDRYHKKNREFYRKRIPCNILMINEERDVNMIKWWPSMIDNGESTAGESPASLVPTPQLMISERLKEILEEDNED